MTYLDSIIHGRAVTPLDRTTRALVQAGVSVEHCQASPQMSAVIDAAWDLPLTLDSAVWLIGVALTMADDLDTHESAKDATDKPVNEIMSQLAMRDKNDQT